MYLHLGMLLLVSTTALAAEVEVKPGDDIRALTQSLGPGSVYIFTDGVYEMAGELRWVGLGTEADPIVFRAAPGAKPVIRLAADASRILLIDDSAFMKVQGLTFEMDDTRYTNRRDNGIQIDTSTDIVLEDVVVRHTGGTSLYLSGNNTKISVTGSEFSDTRDGSGAYVGCGDASCWTQDSQFVGNLFHDLRSDDPNRSDGFTIAPGGQGNVVADNVFFSVNRIGILTHSTEFGPQNVIEGNAIWNTGKTGLWISGSALVRNNVVFAVGEHALYSENNREGLENLVVSFNTFADSGFTSVRLRGWQGRSGMVFANNVVANPLGEAIHLEAESTEGLLLSTNFVTGRVQGMDPDLGHVVAGGGYTDFLDPVNWNYYPSRSSMLRSSADPSGSTFVPGKDFNGFDRNGEKPTVGAYEYVGADNPGWLIQEDFKVFEDNRVDIDDPGKGCCGSDGSASDAALALPLLGLGWTLRRRVRRGQRKTS